jgi:hypothetical protein
VLQEWEIHRGLEDAWKMREEEACDGRKKMCLFVMMKRSGERRKQKDELGGWQSCK